MGARLHAARRSTCTHSIFKRGDYDIAVFLKNFHDRWSEVDRLIPVVTDILYDDGAFIHAMPYREGAYRDRTPLMHEIRREGVDL